MNYPGFVRGGNRSGDLQHERDRAGGIERCFSR
jgi:hypothetical protein